CGVMKKNDVLIGLSIALCVIRPQIAIFLLSAAVGLKRWKAFVWFVVFMCVLLTATSEFVGWKNILAYPSIVYSLDDSSKFFVADTGGMVSIRGPLFLTIHDPLALRISTFVMLIGTLVCVLIWHRITEGFDKQMVRIRDQEFIRWAISLT